MFAEPLNVKEDEITAKNIAYRRSPGSNMQWRTITTLSYTPDGKTLISGSLDGHVRLYDPDAMKILKTLKTSSLEVYAVAVAPDSKLIATTGSCPEVQIWELATGKVLHRLHGHAGCIAALAFSPDGKLLASGGYDSSIRLWDTTTWTERRRINGDLDRVTSVAFSPDGQLLASGGILTANKDDGLIGPSDTVKIWVVSTGRFKRELPVQGFQVSFAPDGNSILAAGMITLEEPVIEKRMARSWNGYGSIVQYDLQANVRLLDTIRKGHGSSFALAKNGQRFASIMNMTAPGLHAPGGLNSDRNNGWSVLLWETASRTVITGLKFKEKEYHTIAAFSSDNRRVAIGDLHGNVVVHSLIPNGVNSLLPARKPVFEDDRHLWLGLSSPQAEYGYAAEWELLKNPAATVKLIQSRLQPKPAAEIAEADGWIRDLDVRNFETRFRSRSKLRRDGWSILPLLRRAVDETESVHIHKELNKLIRDILTDKPAEEYSAQVRAINLLEMIDSPESRALLRQLSEGPKDATITANAKAALERLK